MDSGPNESRKLRVLLTNDDGPPGPDSPYIYGFARRLSEFFGKAFHITEIVRGCFYYPRIDGRGETSFSQRNLLREEGEMMEWILLDGTPATCSNIGLHNLFKDQIDLVISGPNLGRNSSAAFALSSGTIGAALSGALSGIRSIAVSYGTVHRPVPVELHEPAHDLSCRIIQRLLSSWPQSTKHGSAPDLYNINIPMVQELLPEHGGMQVVWTHMWRSRYGQLFKAIQDPAVNTIAGNATVDAQPGGPDASSEFVSSDGGNTTDRETPAPDSAASSPLVFKFAPDADFQKLIFPEFDSLPVGSDGWAIAQNWASVTPLCASFAEPGTVLDVVGDSEGDSNAVKLFKL